MTISVCIGSACHLKGSYEIINRLKALIEENNCQDDVVMKASFCHDNCLGAVSVKVDNELYTVRPETTDEFFYKVMEEKMSK